ncbi:MAG: hypothetical protein ACI909_003341, partial [Planctomycetota bacterium]
LSTYIHVGTGFMLLQTLSTYIHVGNAAGAWMRRSGDVQGCTSGFMLEIMFRTISTVYVRVNVLQTLSTYIHVGTGFMLLQTLSTYIHVGTGFMLLQTLSTYIHVGNAAGAWMRRSGGFKKIRCL